MNHRLAHYLDSFQIEYNLSIERIKELKEKIENPIMEEPEMLDAKYDPDMFFPDVVKLFPPWSKFILLLDNYDEQYKNTLVHINCSNIEDHDWKKKLILNGNKSESTVVFQRNF